MFQDSNPSLNFHHPESSSDIFVHCVRNSTYIVAVAAAVGDEGSLPNADRDNGHPVWFHKYVGHQREAEVDRMSVRAY